MLPASKHRPLYLPAAPERSDTAQVLRAPWQWMAASPQEGTCDPGDGHPLTPQATDAKLPCACVKLGFLAKPVPWV